jgi:hypothetical protein
MVEDGWSRANDVIRWGVGEGWAGDGLRRVNVGEIRGGMGKVGGEVKYRGTSLIKNSLPQETCSSICLGPYGGPRGGGGFLCARYPCTGRPTRREQTG